MAKRQNYTVVGIYEDNKAPFGMYVRARTPIQAAAGAYKRGDGWTDLLILSVLEGKHPDVLANDEALDRDKVRELAAEEIKTMQNKDPK